MDIVPLGTCDEETLMECLQEARAPVTVRGWVVLGRRRRPFAEVSRRHRSSHAPPPEPARRLTHRRVRVFPATFCDGDCTGRLAVMKEVFGFPAQQDGSGSGNSGSWRRFPAVWSRSWPAVYGEGNERDGAGGLLVSDGVNK
nr:hypothetical protein Iba_chr15aCG11540 [Ipomoea batatas]